MLAAFAAALALSSNQGISVRTGKVDLTPPVPLALGGYTERRGALFGPGGDPLYSRSLVFEVEGTRIAVVSLEMLTVPESLYREVRKRLPPDVRLFLTATHTHCAPDSQMLNDRMTIPVPGIARFDPKWLEWYADRIARGIDEALRAEPESIKSLAYRAAHANLNRPRRRGGTPDSAVFRLFSDQRTLITHFAAHPVFYGPVELHLRSDWPGAVTNGGLVLQGAIGDVSPVAPAGSTPSERVDTFAMAFESVLQTSTPVPLRNRPFGYVDIPIELGQPAPHPEFAKRYGVNDAFAQTLVRSFAPASARVTAFRIGKLAVIGVPGEPTGALGKRIRDAGRRAGFEVCLVVSHVNGWIGYVLEPADYDRGGYEATLSFHGRETGERVYQAARKAISELSRAATRGKQA